jgi:hypothetical protein
MFKLALIPFAALMLVPTVVSANPINGDNYLRYSYRDHHRAYGVNSQFDSSLPPDEYYYDPCYQWVSTRHGSTRILACRF